MQQHSLLLSTRTIAESLSLSTSPRKHQTTEAATIGPSLISAAVDVVPLKKLSGGRRSLAGRRWYVDRIYNHLTPPIQTRIPKVNHRGRRYPSYSRVDCLSGHSVRRLVNVEWPGKGSTR